MLPDHAKDNAKSILEIKVTRHIEMSYDSFIFSGKPEDMIEDMLFEYYVINERTAWIKDNVPTYIISSNDAFRRQVQTALDKAKKIFTDTSGYKTTTNDTGLNFISISRAEYMNIYGPAGGDRDFSRLTSAERIELENERTKIIHTVARSKVASIIGSYEKILNTVLKENRGF